MECSFNVCLFVPTKFYINFLWKVFTQLGFLKQPQGVQLFENPGTQKVEIIFSEEGRKKP